jgi:hypothetical protein
MNSRSLLAQNLQKEESSLRPHSVLSGITGEITCTLYRIHIQHSRVIVWWVNTWAGRNKGKTTNWWKANTYRQSGGGVTEVKNCSLPAGTQTYHFHRNLHLRTVLQLISCYRPCCSKNLSLEAIEERTWSRVAGVVKWNTYNCFSSQYHDPGPSQ